MDATVYRGGTQALILGSNLRVEKQIRDALLLSDFALKTGFKAPDGTPIPPDIISRIETASVKLGFLEQVGLPAIGAARGSISASEWVEFELAYYKLSTLMSPITAQSLNDTEPDAGYTSTNPFSWEHWKQKILGTSPANRFARGIWIAAIFFALFVVGADCVVAAKFMPDNLPLRLVQILTLYAYGGLGACAYLLRSAHTFIYRRTFDVRREPEYYNRILLGAIAGGTITLFVNQTLGDKNAAVQLSSAALGFIAGYSTDFLFSKIESIINVLLPKDRDEKAKSSGASRSASTPIVAQTDGSLSDLAEARSQLQLPSSPRTQSNGRRRKAQVEAGGRVG